MKTSPALDMTGISFQASISIKPGGFSIKPFKGLKPPLKYTIEGDYSPDGGLDLFSRGLGNDSYLAYVSPEIVEHISDRLAKLPISDFLNQYGADKQDKKYCLPYFKDLVRLYRYAANNGEAIFISIQ